MGKQKSGPTLDEEETDCQRRSQRLKLKPVLLVKKKGRNTNVKKKLKKTASMDKRKTIKSSLKRKSRDELVKVSHDKNMEGESCDSINSIEENKSSCEEYTISCPVCEKKCKNKVGCTQHVLRTHKNYCMQCDSLLSSDENMSQHLASHNIYIQEGSRVYVCEVCGKNYKVYAHFKDHMCSHKNEMHECDVCHKKLKTLSTLSQHKNTVHRDVKEKKYRCGFCDKAFWSRSDMKVHIRIHTDDRPFLCHVCSKTFRHSGHLITHHRTMHEDQHFLCEVCGEKFKSRKKYLNHGLKTGHIKDVKLKPADSRTFMCEECGKVFSRKADRKVHLRIHSGSKPFSCSDCGRSFRCSNHLKQHRVVHTGEKPFICTYCSKGFSQLANVNCHMKKCLSKYRPNEDTSPPNESNKPTETFTPSPNENEKLEETVTLCSNKDEESEEPVECLANEEGLPEEPVEKQIEINNPNTENNEHGREAKEPEFVLFYVTEEVNSTKIVSQDTCPDLENVAMDTEDNFLQGNRTKIENPTVIENVFVGESQARSSNILSNIDNSVSISQNEPFHEVVKDKVIGEGLVEGHLVTQIFSTENVESHSVIIPIVEVVKLEGKGERSMEGEVHTPSTDNASRTVQINGIHVSNQNDSIKDVPLELDTVKTLGGEECDMYFCKTDHIIQNS